MGVLHPVSGGDEVREITGLGSWPRTRRESARAVREVRGAPEPTDLGGAVSPHRETSPARSRPDHALNQCDE